MQLPNTTPLSHAKRSFAFQGGATAVSFYSTKENKNSWDVNEVVRTPQADKGPIHLSEGKKQSEYFFLES